MQDIVNNYQIGVAKAVGNVTATANGATIDLQYFQGPIAFAFYLSAVATADVNNFFTVKVQASDSSTFATGNVLVTDTPTRIIGNQIVVNSTAMAGTVQKMGVTLATKRYLRVQLILTGTADITGTMLYIMGGARNQPVA